MVAMRKWVGCLVEILVKLDRAHGNIERNIELRKIVCPRAKNTHLNACFCVCAFLLQIAAYKSKEVGGHAHRALKDVIAIFAGYFRLVGKCAFTRLFVEFHRQIKGGLCHGFIYARKCFARKRGFKLRADELAFFAVQNVVGRVNTHHGVGEARAIVNFYAKLALRLCRRENRECLIRIRAFEAAACAVYQDRCDVEIFLVELEGGRLRGAFDHNRSAKALFFSTDVELERIVLRREVVEEALRGCGRLGL